MKLLFVGLSAFALSACVVIHASPDTLMPAGSEKVTLNDFSGIELRGGGDIEIEHGAEFTFTDTGDRHDWKIGIEKGNEPDGIFCGNYIVVKQSAFPTLTAEAINQGHCESLFKEKIKETYERYLQ